MQYRFKRGTEEDHTTYIGPPRTFSVVTDLNELRMHDGVTPGGIPSGNIPAYIGADPNIPYGLKNGKWEPLNTGAVLPTGPGSDEPVAGDTAEGYMGTVSAADLFTAEDLADLVGLTSGSLANNNTDWAKFIISDVVCFVPLLPIRGGISWDQLYDAGLVYGTDGPGPYYQNSAVSQKKTVTKDGNNYKVRLMLGGETNPTNYPEDSYSIPGGDSSSEWTRLMARIHDGTWDSFTLDELGIAWNSLGAHTLCQETFASDNTARVFRGIHNGDIGYCGSTDSGVTDYLNGWRPILELI